MKNRHPLRHARSRARSRARAGLAACRRVSRRRLDPRRGRRRLRARAARGLRLRHVLLREPRPRKRSRRSGLRQRRHRVQRPVHRALGDRHRRVDRGPQRWALPFAGLTSRTARCSCTASGTRTSTGTAPTATRAWTAGSAYALQALVFLEPTDDHHERGYGITETAVNAPFAVGAAYLAIARTKATRWPRACSTRRSRASRAHSRCTASPRSRSLPRRAARRARHGCHARRSSTTATRWDWASAPPELSESGLREGTRTATAGSHARTPRSRRGHQRACRRRRSYARTRCAPGPGWACDLRAAQRGRSPRTATWRRRSVRAGSPRSWSIC